MKKIIALILAIMMTAVLFAGCQKTETPAETKPASGTETTPATDTTPEYLKDNPQYDKSASIEAWDMSCGPADKWDVYYQTIAKEFADKAGIKVTATTCAWDNFMQMYLTAIQSNAMPDILMSGFGQQVLYDTMGAMNDCNALVDYFKNNGYSDDKMAFSLETYKNGDRYVGLPIGGVPFAYVYRKDLTDKAGLSKLPTNWSEWLDWLRGIKKAYPDMSPVVFPQAGAQGNHVALYLFITNEAGAYDKDMKPMFETDKAMEVYNLMITLQKEELVPGGINGYAEADANKLYCSGGAVSLLIGSMAQVQNTPEIAKVSDIAPIIKGPSAKEQHTYAWVNAMGVSSQTKFNNEAQGYLKYWFEQVYRNATEGGYPCLPPLKSDLDKLISAGVFDESNPVTAGLIRECVGHIEAPCYPHQSVYVDFTKVDGQNVFAQVGQTIFNGQTDPAAVGKYMSDFLKTAVAS